VRQLAHFDDRLKFRPFNYLEPKEGVWINQIRA